MGYVFCFVVGAWLSAGVVAIWYIKHRADLVRRKAELDVIATHQHAEKIRLSEVASRLEQDRFSLNTAAADYEGRKVKYESLLAENTDLKRDLFNLSVQVRKLQRDHSESGQSHAKIGEQCSALAVRYIDEKKKWIGSKLTPNNFASSKEQLLGAIEACRSIGFEIAKDQENDMLNWLKAAFEEEVRREVQREEQARIKAQIREEERVKSEIAKELADAEREKAVVKAAIDRALADVVGDHTAELELLRQRLAEAEAKSARAISQAQLTKAGHVYVISNLGTFGENVFKIGMTRRLRAIGPRARTRRRVGSVPVRRPHDDFVRRRTSA